MAPFRLRVANLPAAFAEHAPAICGQLQANLNETYGVNAQRVHMARDWVNRRGDRAWAFIELGSETEGN